MSRRKVATCLWFHVIVSLHILICSSNEAIWNPRDIIYYALQWPTCISSGNVTIPRLVQLCLCSISHRRPTFPSLTVWCILHTKLENTWKSKAPKKSCLKSLFCAISSISDLSTPKKHIKQCNLWLVLSWVCSSWTE